MRKSAPKYAPQENTRADTVANACLNSAPSASRAHSEKTKSTPSAERSLVIKRGEQPFAFCFLVLCNTPKLRHICEFASKFFVGQLAIHIRNFDRSNFGVFQNILSYLFRQSSFLRLQRRAVGIFARVSRRIDVEVVFSFLLFHDNTLIILIVNCCGVSGNFQNIMRPDFRIMGTICAE